VAEFIDGSLSSTLYIFEAVARSGLWRNRDYLKPCAIQAREPFPISIASKAKCVYNKHHYKAGTPWRMNRRG